MYTHSSQIKNDDVMPWSLSPKAAQKLAEVFGLEAYQDSKDYTWAAFSDDSDEFVSLDNKLIVNILNYARGDQ